MAEEKEIEVKEHPFDRRKVEIVNYNIPIPIGRELDGHHFSKITVEKNRVDELIEKLEEVSGDE